VALKSCATSIILGHNHPSGNLDPSDADKKITRQLSEAGKMLEIPVIDHLILTSDSFFSMADEGYL
jgi:DNA repair protein RadC